MTTLVTGAFGYTARGRFAVLAAGERPVVFDLGDDPWRVRMIAGDDAGVRRTLDEFARLQQAGRLDCRELA